MCSLNLCGTAGPTLMLVTSGSRTVSALKRCFGARNGSGYKGEDSPHLLFVGRLVWRQSPRRELIQLTAGLLRGSASSCSASPIPPGHASAWRPPVSPRTPHQHCWVPGGLSRAEPGALRFNQSPKGSALPAHLCTHRVCSGLHAPEQDQDQTQPGSKEPFHHQTATANSTNGLAGARRLQK